MLVLTGLSAYQIHIRGKLGGLEGWEGAVMIGMDVGQSIAISNLAALNRLRYRRGEQHCLGAPFIQGCMP